MDDATGRLSRGRATPWAIYRGGVLSDASAASLPDYRAGRLPQNEDFSLGTFPDRSGRMYPTMEAAKQDSSLRCNTPEMRPVVEVLGPVVTALMARLPQATIAPKKS